MVCSLQHPDRCGRHHLRQALLDRGSDVAGQDDRHVAVPDLQHQRVVVAHPLAFPVGAWRVPGAHGHRPSRRRSPAWTVRQAARVRVGARRELREHGVARHGHALPDLPRTEHLEHRAGAAHMVGVTVRHGEHVEAAHT